MNIPINQKCFITIVEAEEYFSIGRKSLRAFAAKHPELAFLHGNRWLIFREGMEKQSGHLWTGRRHWNEKTRAGSRSR